MKYHFSEHQLLHRPTQYVVHGRIVNPFENGERASVLQSALEDADVVRAAAKPTQMEQIHAVHAGHYLDFLREAYTDFMALPNHGPEVLPNVHAYIGASASYEPRPKPRTTGILGRSGWYVGDLSAAIMEGTYPAVIASAQSAIGAADEILLGAAASFALCRPPGHHAYVDRASGFCFLNNAAIAVEVLRKTFARVALLDFDTHHGDGSQAIFYQRDDVFFGSTHTDPSAYYPHFAGYADERGAGKGTGYNLNLPLAYGSDDAAFIAANVQLMEAARERGAEALVLSAGWDAHHLDPFSKLAVTTDAYARIGELYGRQKLPTVIVQEGGYSLQGIREAATAFVKGFRSARGC